LTIGQTVRAHARVPIPCFLAAMCEGFDVQAAGGGGAVLAQQVILFAVASAAYPSTIRGTAFGAAIGVGRLGSLIGPLFAAWLIAGGKSSSQVLMGILPIVIVAGLSVFLLGWQKRTERSAAG
jgi:nitrate/nitrite transporter NarK